MSNSELQKEWVSYVASMQEQARALLAPLNIELDEHQPHTMGERFLMQAVTTTSGKKVILLGKNTETEQRCVVKITTDKAGKQEINHERKARTFVQSLDFNYENFSVPQEIVQIESGDYLMNVQEYIEQTGPFLKRPIEEQFDFALQGFSCQGGTRATTSRHFKRINSVFGNRDITKYKSHLNSFKTTTKNYSIEGSDNSLIESAVSHLFQNAERIEQYGNFLTHTDFVPHNFRIRQSKIFLLDFSSLTFGNKHESWARFLNFMTLYNRELESLLLRYVETNRSWEERESLQLMRLYRLCEIIAYYSKKSSLTEDKLGELNKQRVQFWTDVLRAEIEDKRVDEAIVSAYQKERDRLRSEDEKIRQTELH